MLWHKLSEDLGIGEGLLGSPGGEEGEELELPQTKLQTATVLLESDSVHHGPPVRV